MKPVFPQSAVMKVQGMPTPDRVVVRPDSVLIVTGTTACRSLGFPVRWSLFRRVIQFEIF
jgi:hypothetical protein